MKIAAFDFCDTIIKFQTGDLFMEMFIKEKGTFWRKFRLKVIQFLSKIYFYKVIDKVFRVFIKKQRLMSLLKGYSKEDIEEFSLKYANFLSQNKIAITDDLWKDYLTQGYQMCVVSAGFSCYIEKLYDKNVKVIANEFLFDENNKCLGKMKQKDCYGKEKVNRFLQEYDNQYDYLVFVTDSFSDLPMIDLANKAFLVKKKDNKYFLEDNLEKGVSR